ncbi:hypothetical protein G9A89_009946 [Geosiphon pyriformis]|nr:hypothetical protein G9A89_009946 [Geosiphon pyriformis]
MEDDPEEFYEHYQQLALMREEQKQHLEHSSSTQYSNKDNNNLDSSLNSETYIALPDLTKEQELKWFSNNNKSIITECAHDTNAGFDLRYPRKDSIKLEPHSHICIDLKIALEIPATTMVQLVFRSSLVKKGINIRKEIINTGYIENIIAMLQNDSEKAYNIDPNEKIAQTIFLLLVKIVQLVLVGNREKLGITGREIQKFKFMGRINIPVNMVEKKIIDKEEIISTHQTISIPPYDQYMLAIKRKLCGYVNITLQTIYGQSECYQLQSEQLEQINMKNLDPFQQMQLRMLLNNFNNIFANENEFGHTNIIQHQIKTGDAMPIKQRAYRVLPVSHEIIHQKINRMLDNRLIQLSISP